MNPPSTKETRTANLNRIQEERKQQTLAKVEQTLERMIKQGMKINFSTLAKEANVSESYLYKYPEIKTKIAELRNQQSSMPRPRNSETASAKSNQVIVSRLKDRIKKLEAEVTGLRNINEGLAGRVYRVSELEAMVERQQNCIKDLENRLRAYESHNLTLAELPTEISKVTSIDKGKRRKSDIPEFVDIPESVKDKLEPLDITLTSTLINSINSAPEEVVSNAIEAVEEAIASGDVLNRGALLYRAIQNKWAKNKSQVQQTSTQNPLLYTKPEESEDELLSPEQIKELLKELKK